MNLAATLRWAAIYRLVSWTLGLVFLGFVYLGFRLSVGGIPLGLGPVADAVASPRFLGPALVGFLVWQAGTTVAYYATVAGAVEEEMAERFDAQMVKSEILEVLDERLAEMEDQLRRTRSEVQDRHAGGATTGGDDFGFES